MLNPTRINLLMLKEKHTSIKSSISILKSRRRALVKELLETGNVLLQSRNELSNLYTNSIKKLKESIGYLGASTVNSLCEVTKRDILIDIKDETIWGLRYKEAITNQSAVRSINTRGYDARFTPPVLEDCIYQYEKIIDLILNISTYENKLKRLSQEIIKTTRRTRVLEERVQPNIKSEIKFISSYIGERERESFYKIKKLKTLKSKQV